MNTKRKNKISQLLLIMFFIILCVLVIYPFLLVIGVSLSNEEDILIHGYSVIPKKFDASAYRYIFKNTGSILQAYKITTIFSFVSMALSVLLMAMIAFPLTRRNLKGRTGISFYLYFTMVFSGGLVPTYILITNFLHLDDTIWVYILPSLISPWYIFMMRTFFQSLPNEIFESVKIDGGNTYQIFFRFVLPLSKPVLATVALFMLLGKWNDWYTSMLYINNEDLVSLQYLLQRIMENIQLLQNMSGSINMLEEAAKIPSETVRMAMVIVVAGPALFVFPLFQRYFVRGLTVGGVKG